MTGFFLASLHHLLFLGVVIMLAAQMALLRVSPLPIVRLAKLDIGYGASILLLLAVGWVRVIWGEKGWAFYADNHFFWAKMFLLVLVGCASILPTVNFIVWRKRQRIDHGFQPDERDIRRTRRLVVNQIVLLVFLTICAAGMARWPL